MRAGSHTALAWWGGGYRALEKFFTRVRKKELSGSQAIRELDLSACVHARLSE